MSAGASAHLIDHFSQLVPLKLGIEAVDNGHDVARSTLKRASRPSCRPKKVSCDLQMIFFQKDLVTGQTQRNFSNFLMVKFNF